MVDGSVECIVAVSEGKLNGEDLLIVELNPPHPPASHLDLAVTNAVLTEFPNVPSSSPSNGFFLNPATILEFELRLMLTPV